MQRETDAVAVLIRQCVEGNAVHAQNQEEYNAYYNGLAEKYEEQRKALERLAYEKRERVRKADAFSNFMREITQLPEMNIVFGENRFNKTVDHITVYNDGRPVFSFFVGKDITVET